MFFYLSGSLAIDYVPLSRNSKLSQEILKADTEFLEYFKRRLTFKELREVINNVNENSYRNYFEFYWAFEVKKIEPSNKLIRGLKTSELTEASIALGLYYDYKGKLESAKKILCEDFSVAARFYCGRMLVERRVELKRGIGILKEMAKIGNIDAIGVLGTFHCSNRNYKECNRYLSRLPIDQNLVYFHNLGLNYLYGRGVSKDIDKAIFYFNKSSIVGHFPSIYALGISYVEKNNIKKAIELLQQASLGGDHRASLKLGALFRDQAKSRDDIDISFKYLLLAEQAGFKQAYSIRVQINMALYRLHREEQYLKDAQKAVEDVRQLDSVHAEKLQDLIEKSKGE